MDKEKNKQGGRSSARVLPLVLMLILAAVCAVCLIYMGYVHYDIQLENEAEVIKTSAIQAASGLDMQFAKLEDVSVTLLANKEYTEFDAADYNTHSEYEITQTLNEIKNYVTGLSLIDNYCDFTLIYRNDAAAGKLSEGTKEQLCNDDGKVYPILDDLLEGRRRVWVTGVNGSYNKVYYISRASEHAIFIGGFYSEELRYMVADANRVKNSTLILEDGKGSTIMTVSSSKNELTAETAESDNGVLVTDNKVQASQKLDNGWKVVLIKDMTDTFEFYKKLALETAVVLVLTLSIIVVIYTVRIKDDPMLNSGRILTPEVDMLTGITNAEEAENTIADRLETCPAGSTYMLALVKIVNMEELGKRYGRAGYNGSIIKTYRGLAEFFGTDDPTSENIVGRIGEGKFIVMANFTQYDLFKANDALKEGIMKLSEHMNCVMLANEGDVHICIGAAIFPHNSSDYDELYDMAEKALNDAVEDDERSYAVYSKKGLFKKQT